jgi:predicted RNA-binding protein with RPS1 domain
MRSLWVLLVLLLFVPFSTARYADEYRELFNGKDLDDWVAEGDKEYELDGKKLPVWVAKDGMLTCMVNTHKSYGFLRYTKQEFADFRLHLEYRMTPRTNEKETACNSGIGIRTVPFDPKQSDKTRPSRAAYEVQLLDDADTKPNVHSTASLYNYVAPKVMAAKPAPEWNVIDPEGPPKIGQEVEVTIEGFDNANGLILLSRKGAAMTAEWSSVAEGMIVEARVTETNKGGLAVDVNGIRGFMPISQIDLYRVEDVEQFVNQRLRCLITEVDPEEHNLVVSRRALLEKEREENREKLWAQLAEGQVYEGIVRSLKEFGAFVDIGGVDGLLHVSEMSWHRVADPSKFVQPGQKVKVVVLKIDPERRKVSFGMKQLTESPWDSAMEKYPHGKIVTGKVTRVMDFGAFVELEPALEGLIHISELSPTRVRRVIDVVKVGQDVQVMVLNVDKEQRRISLSLKAALPEEPETSAEDAEEEAIEMKPQRTRTTPLRGGIGDKPQVIVSEEEE